MESIKRFGKLDWSKPVAPSKMQLNQATNYLIRVLDMLDTTYGLEGKCVADIGGSNISPEIVSLRNRFRVTMIINLIEQKSVFPINLDKFR
ncbi:MAG: hypothetical protein K2N87_10045 [Eubacterium sp.]|nr:hypothetical protein [Eubacterium sp.]